MGLTLRYTEGRPLTDRNMTKLSRTATTGWRRVAREVRSEGRSRSAPCHLCRGALGPIDYRTQREANQEAQASGRYWEINAPRPLAFAADHIIPHAAGGLDTLDNAAPSHALCNERAGAKDAVPKPRTPTLRPTVGRWWLKNGKAPRYPAERNQALRRPPTSSDPKEADMTEARSMLRAIEQNPDNAAERLKALREIVATRLDETESARETGTLARCILDIETALRAHAHADEPASSVDELLKRRAARGAR